MRLPQLGHIDVTKVYRIRCLHGIAPFSSHSFAVLTRYAMFGPVQFHDTIRVAL